MTLDRSLLTLGLILLASSLMACDWGEKKPAASNPPKGESRPAVGATSAPAVESYTFHGTALAIDTARGIITVDHEKIGDLMDAMTMPFQVADRALLSQVTIGKETHFTIVVDSSRMQIVKIQDGHDPGHEH